MSFNPPHIPYIRPNLPSGHISGVYNHIQEEYEDLLKKAKPNEDVAATVFLFGGTEITVKTFGYAGPNLLIVNGQIHGKDVRAYVHQSSLQVIFSLVPKDSKIPRTPLGFVAPRSSEEEKNDMQ